jgi:ribosome maturation factor RimP
MRDEKATRLAEVERMAREVATSLDLEVVEFVFHSRGKHSLLRIDIDRAGVPGAGIADCEALSRALEDPLERVDFFDAPYELQVSTPGIDRPIRTSDDVRRNAGRSVRIEYRDPAGRVTETHGVLLGGSPGGRVRIASPEGDLELDFERIVLMKQDLGLAGPRRKAR